MVESVKLNDLEVTLKPFYQRASEAEDRLSRLEAAFNSRKETGNEEQLKVIEDLQSKLNATNAELISEKQKSISEKQKLISEKQKSQSLAGENEKLKYHIVHLLRSLKDADTKLEQVAAREKLESLNLKDS